MALRGDFFNLDGSSECESFYQVIDIKASVNLAYETEDWLVDSGATSHTVAEKFLFHYEVLKYYQMVRYELKAANGKLIRTSGVVDL